MTVNILKTVEIDNNAPSIHSGFDYDTARKLDTLFSNWTFESNRADYRGFADDDQNTRADVAYANYISALHAAEKARDDDYDASMLDASNRS